MKKQDAMLFAVVFFTVILPNLFQLDMGSIFHKNPMLSRLTSEEESVKLIKESFERQMYYESFKLSKIALEKFGEIPEAEEYYARSLGMIMRINLAVAQVYCQTGQYARAMVRLEILRNLLEKNKLQPPKQYYELLRKAVKGRLGLE